MSVQVSLLTAADEAEYEALVRSLDESLFYGSLLYRAFLRRVLAESEDYYLVARAGGRLVGCLPAFVRTNARHGNVLNSLPFFGSHGGVIVASDERNRSAVRSALLQELYALCEYKQIVSSTIVVSPLDPDAARYEEDVVATFRDTRIGQLTFLPAHADDAGERLMGMFDQKTRNSVRKAQKSEVVVRHSGTLGDLHTLAELHRESMAAIGGTAKPWSVFAAIRETFAYDRDYRVYLAERGGAVIAALLVFFFNRTAEYYTPATQLDQRMYQPMSLLIFEAMQEAARRGCRVWNWGGTWLSQIGVYAFKAGWGTRDIPYTYYISAPTEAQRLRLLDRATLLREYPSYYVLPFDTLTPQ